MLTVVQCSANRLRLQTASGIPINPDVDGVVMAPGPQFLFCALSRFTTHQSCRHLNSRLTCSPRDNSLSSVKADSSRKPSRCDLSLPLSIRLIIPTQCMRCVFTSQTQ